MKSRLIICEGYDGSGKSTLARAIAKKTGALYFHFTWTPNLSGSSMKDHVDAVSRSLVYSLKEHPTLRIVLDRAPWISEKVYAPIFRPGQQADLVYAERLWSQFDPLLILCTRDNPVEFHAEHQDSAHPYGKRPFAKVVKAYKQVGEDWSSDMFLKSRLMLYHVNSIPSVDEWVDANLS